MFPQAGESGGHGVLFARNAEHPITIFSGRCRECFLDADDIARER
jgi:hypothetical protein